MYAYTFCSSELLNLHRYLFEELSRVQFLPQSVQLDQFFSILERTFPNFSLYNPFLDESRQENVQVRQSVYYTVEPHIGCTKTWNLFYYTILKVKEYCMLKTLTVTAWIPVCLPNDFAFLVGTHLEEETNQLLQTL